MRYIDKFVDALCRVTARVLLLNGNGIEYYPDRFKRNAVEVLDGMADTQATRSRMAGVVSRTLRNWAKKESPLPVSANPVFGIHDVLLRARNSAKADDPDAGWLTAAEIVKDSGLDLESVEKWLAKMSPDRVTEREARRPSRIREYRIPDHLLEEPLKLATEDEEEWRLAVCDTLAIAVDCAERNFEVTEGELGARVPGDLGPRKDAPFKGMGDLPIPLEKLAEAKALATTFIARLRALADIKQAGTDRVANVNVFLGMVIDRPGDHAAPAQEGASTHAERRGRKGTSVARLVFLLHTGLWALASGYSRPHVTPLTEQTAAVTCGPWETLPVTGEGLARAWETRARLAWET